MPENTSHAPARRVVVFANSSWYLYHHRRNIISMLAGEAQVTCIAPTDDYADKLRSLGAQFIALPMAPQGKNPFGEAFTLLRLLLVFAKLKPHAVLTFTIKANLYSAILAHLFRYRQIPNIAGLGEAFDRNGWLHRRILGLYRVAFSAVHQVFFENCEDLATFQKLGLLPQDKGVRIPGAGIDLDLFHPGESHAARDCRVFLMLGRLIPKKGYDDFLAAAEQLKPKLGDRVEFWILGMEDPHRKESRELAQRIAKAAEKGVVKSFPASDQVVDYLQKASVVVLPSQYNEGVPRSLIEALACGKPAVTTDWKGCRDAVEHDLTGLLIEPGSISDLCKAIERFAVMGAEEFRAFEKQSRRKAERDYNEAAVLDWYRRELVEAV